MNQYRDSSIFPKMEQLHSKTSELLNTIGNIQTKMIAESEGKRGNPALIPVQISHTEDGPEIQFKLLTKPFHPGPVRNFLLPACNSRQELNRALAEYINYFSDLTPGKDIIKFKDLLDPSIFLPGETKDYEQISLMSGLHSLELLKISILTIELHLLLYVANK
jgi:hypothetical protein